MGAAENRQIVADAYAAVERGDIGTVMGLFTDDVVWTSHDPQAAPISGVFHGKEGVRRFFELAGAALDHSRFDVRTIVADGDAVVVWVDSVATVRSNSKTIDGPVVHWMTLHDGKIATWDKFEHHSHEGWT